MNYLEIALCALIALLFIKVDNLKNRQRQIEKKINMLSKKDNLIDSNLNISEELKENLKVMIANGEDVKAIKKLKDEADLSLQEAKDFIESLY